MGFEEKVALRALNQYRNDVNMALDLLFEGSLIPSNEEQQLKAMGFLQEEDILKALNMSRNDVSKAVELLMSENLPSDGRGK